MTDSTARPVFGAFVPVLLLALSVFVFLAGDVAVAFQQHLAGLRIADQQQQQFAQAAAIEDRLRQIMQDLVVLGDRNPEAAVIVKKYGISFRPSAAPGTPAPVTAAPDAPAAPSK